MDGEYRLVGTGATFRTSASNPRVELDSSSFRSINAGGTVLIEVPTGGAPNLRVFGSDSGPGQIQFCTGSPASPTVRAQLFTPATNAGLNVLPPSAGTGFLTLGSTNVEWGTIHITGTTVLVRGGTSLSRSQVRLATGTVEVIPFGTTTRIKADVNGLGFFGANTVTKPSVTGDWTADPVACAKSTLAALAALGLVTNNTTNF